MATSDDGYDAIGIKHFRDELNIIMNRKLHPFHEIDPHAQKQVKALARKVFDNYDINQSNTLGFKEFSHCLQVFEPEVPENDVLELLERLDVKSFTTITKGTELTFKDLIRVIKSMKI